MPENSAICRAKQEAKQGKALSTQAGESVREEVEHIRSSVPDARPAMQASAIGMSRGHRSCPNLYSGPNRFELEGI
jgi:hypothetical protein